MLTRKDFGLHLTGRVDSISPVDHKSGKSAKGNEYSFYQQIITLALGGQMFEVGYRADNDPRADLCPFELDQIVKVRVENPRLYAGKVSFDAVVD